MSQISRITQTFADLQASNKMAFMPFVTAGDPDMAATKAMIEELSRRGVNLIEVGFPYSDPIADGPVIQASYTRALDNGLKVADIFLGIEELDTDNLPPLVAMVSFAIVYRIGVEEFTRRARQVGFAGLIVPDLPGDEASEMAEVAKKVGLDLVELVSPTTPPERVERILQSASGFVYCISVAGTTGVRNELPTALNEQLEWLRTKTDLPLAVGFGISQPDQVDVLWGVADGVIVGSAIVRMMEPVSESRQSVDDAISAVGNFAASMVAETGK